jgi:peptidoglycan/xylan/chitin deacetylase (PgdA/CDA1 family)
MKLITYTLDRYYRAMQRKYPEVLWFGDDARHHIALTFDDGPHPRDTPQVLGILAKYEVQATFFLVGKAVEEHPDLVRKLHQCGHQLGIHCYRHIPFPLETPSTLHAQLDRTRNLIADICGIAPQRISDLRPPYGAFTPKTLSLLVDWGYRVVMWNSIPAHWMQPFRWTISEIYEELIPGSILVLHDGNGHGLRVAQILETVIPELRKTGFDFVTIEQMRTAIKGSQP